MSLGAASAKKHPFFLGGGYKFTRIELIWYNGITNYFDDKSKSADEASYTWLCSLKDQLYQDAFHVELGAFQFSMYVDLLQLSLENI